MESVPPGGELLKMNPSNKILVSLLLIVVTMTALPMGIGAILQAASGPSPETATQADAPTLTEVQAYSLVRSYIIGTVSKSTGAYLMQQCLGSAKIDPVADYRGNDLWAVMTEGGCTFVVNDRTGKVTGP